MVEISITIQTPTRGLNRRQEVSPRRNRPKLFELYHCPQRKSKASRSKTESTPTPSFKPMTSRFKISMSQTHSVAIIRSQTLRTSNHQSVSKHHLSLKKISRTTSIRTVSPTTQAFCSTNSPKTANFIFCQIRTKWRFCQIKGKYKNTTTL